MAATKIQGAAALVLSLALGGCASTPKGVPQGNFLPQSVEQQWLAADTLRQLQVLYLPARTRLALAQPTTDPFGAALLKGLRTSGYAVQEGAKAAQGTDGALPLRYVVDQLGGGLVRVMVTVGGTSISRAYANQAAAGPWMRKE
ncbi:conjugal transfer protein TrbH [Azohydromonas caseinilytica]|uniref:Conjugal transfer protein TrbH n=1 Tax=Azohydromonas caseinilytica TaxID=2728836 RepID=A0A848FGM2_9BURK|nr:conjugal transfer protein TrbH [Azohydromonas caseinilytica]NML17011.1 conjugal transfer protein TrbH [Azohydromonas caseinilytica]